MAQDDRVALLNRINEGLPPGVDWKAGARRYVAYALELNGRAYTERSSFTKPFLGVPPEGPGVAIQTMAWYLSNFTNTVQTLNLPGGSLVLDVACGGGWLSHLMARLDYRTVGIDISEDFVELARRRMKNDPLLRLSAEEADHSFFVHDLEEAPLPEAQRGRFDAVVFESCVHHFYDPITAIENAAAALKDDGIAVILEGENRRGDIRPDFMQVMLETDTLERPYRREDLEAVLRMAGLPEFEFVAPVNGWFSGKVWNENAFAQHLRQVGDGSNFCFAAKRPEALKRIFPWRA